MFLFTFNEPIFFKAAFRRLTIKSLGGINSRTSRLQRRISLQK